MYSKTILYITSNREDPNFEAKIRANILKQKGDLPIISVSQKPINFGKNICVGDVGHTYFNSYRQLLIGAKEAKSDYIVFAEADFLHHTNYFNFEPKGGNIYRYNNIWILYKNPKYYSFRRKEYTIFSQIIKREFMIEILEKNLKNFSTWSKTEVVLKDRHGYDMFRIPFEFFGSEIPSVSFKTGDSLRNYTNVMHGRENIRTSLPYWGEAGNLRKEYFGGDHT